MQSLNLLPHIDETYGTIILDPPWKYRNKNQNGAAQKHYQSLSTAEIACLPIPFLAAKNAVLLLWATMPLLPEAVQLVNAWEFTYKTAITWVKLQNYETLKPAYGTGQWGRGCCELVLVASRGRVPAPKSSDLLLLSERFEHSRKPDSLHDYAERNLPGPYLELFARRERQGWETWGDQAPEKVSTPL